jgi:aerobic carbon-monoxide dehydrogenase medium subunit
LKAPDFAYAKPATLAEALDLLARPGAKALAGGQSLIPSLNMRLSAPELLVDITGLPGLSGISAEGSSVRVGALTTHVQIQKSALIAKQVPLMAKAVPHVAHAAIRNRGTLGGSLANADPAAEYPACAVALEAVIHIAGRSGARQVKAADFFKGLFETDLKAGELITAVDFPAAKPGDRAVFLELARRHGDYAIVGLAVQNRRFVFFGVGSTPAVFSFEGGLDKARDALKAKLRPDADLYNSPATKLHLAGVLLERAWNG